MFMTEKTKKTALPVTDTKPTKPKSPATEEDEQVSRDMTESETAVVPNDGKKVILEETVVQSEPFQLIPPFKISGKAKSMAKGVGIDLSGIEEMAPRMNEWASSVEQRLNVILTAIPNIPAETVRYLQQEAAKQRAEMAQRAQPDYQPQVQQTGEALGGLGGLMQILPAILGSGGNILEGEITKKIIEAGMNQMFAGTRLLEAMQTKMLANMGAKEVEKVTAALP